MLNKTQFKSVLTALALTASAAQAELTYEEWERMNEIIFVNPQAYDKVASHLRTACLGVTRKLAKQIYPEFEVTLALQDMKLTTSTTAFVSYTVFMGEDGTMTLEKYCGTGLDLELIHHADTLPELNTRISQGASYE